MDSERMTREEMDALIAEANGEHRYEMPDYRFDQLVALARLGAKVAAPTEDEIEAMARSYRDQLDEACESLDHPRSPPPYEKLSNLERKVLNMCIGGALSALQEPRP